MAYGMSNEIYWVRYTANKHSRRICIGSSEGLWRCHARRMRRWRSYISSVEDASDRRKIDSHETDSHALVEPCVEVGVQHRIRT